MGGRNYGICHSCRSPGHWMDDCPTKKRCPRCGQGYIRLLEVEKMCDKKGQLFFSCTRVNCRFFEWKQGETSTGPEQENKPKPDMDELSRLMSNCARIANEDDVEVNLITFRKNKGTDRKGKEKIED